MFSSADAHIAICDPQRLPGAEAVIRVADCARVIVKVMQEGDHHAPLPQARLKDLVKAAKLLLPTNLELQLAVRTTVYHWLHAFHDLRWRSKPERQMSPKHLQEWLQADAQHPAV